MSTSGFAHAELTEQVIGCAYEVFNELGFGFLESVYQNSLTIVLRERGLSATVESQIDVYFRGKQVGHFLADLLINEKVIVELKSVRQLLEKHEVQLVNYLNATGIEVGLLINFGPTGVEIRRKVRDLSTIPA